MNMTSFLVNAKEVSKMIAQIYTFQKCMRTTIAPQSWESRLLIWDMNLNFHPLRAKDFFSCRDELVAPTSQGA